MATFDRIFNPLIKFIALASQAVTTSTNGATLSLKGLVSLSFLIDVFAFTSGTAAFKIQVRNASEGTWFDLDDDYHINKSVAPAATGLFEIAISGLGSETMKTTAGATTEGDMDEIRIVQTATIVMSMSIYMIAQSNKR